MVKHSPHSLQLTPILRYNFTKSSHQITREKQQQCMCICVLLVDLAVYDHTSCVSRKMTENPYGHYLSFLLRQPRGKPRNLMTVTSIVGNARHYGSPEVEEVSEAQQSEMCGTRVAKSWYWHCCTLLFTADKTSPHHLLVGFYICYVRFACVRKVLILDV